ncbi:protein kinase RIM15 [Aspergillus clavatus NRRL 1]|uniref:non-specific serine/threonine protein kinase n=1 Tax=Aspergillus clavatus (strain ATCC 1007 / CBS 513.65 / DSM 816 / NCTC 3887 / NRRL 1 / QM 1276 / 107) TaxID=344612 RepID=A1C743_ASPCL|nr:serine threonine protein kinase, putative [Aspergillus clavatus NRRL 1]EAW14214.1 serine threonine protein kinase, putative [Aspergillus clavatus NRRL 1]
MAGNGTPNAQFLAPPAVTALRQEARGIDPKFPSMARSLSDDMREEREELKEAAEQTLNVIVDLDLDGRIKWVSPSWRQVVGTSPDSLEGRLISDFLVDNANAFHDAIQSMKEDDSRSRFIRFAVRMGPESILRYSPESRPLEAETSDGSEEDQLPEGIENNHDILNMEGQGIMVFERTPNGAGHTMWMLRPFSQPREVTIDLPPLLVESLGVGAEVLANYLTILAEAAANEPDPSKYPAPTPILCRICERQITPWWFEKHSDLCLQEHRAEMDVQIAQENLNEHRHAIVKVLDALEARQSRPLAGEGASLPAQPEYKGLPIGPSPTVSAPSSGNVSSSSSAPGTPPRSRDQSVSDGGHHSRGRSFAVRRPLTRIVELILDLCDTALEINMPVIKEPRGDSTDDFRTLSPQSESRMCQVLQWHSPSSNTLEQEQGLAALSADTEQVSKAKVDAVIRHRKIVEYAERIRIEYTVMVEDCITAALSKAERIAAGQLSDSSCSSEDELPLEDITAVPAITDPATVPLASPASSQASTHRSSQPMSALTMSMRNASERFPLPHPEGRSSSVAVSTGSNSPMECPTPRSHKSAAGLLGTSQPSRRGLSMVDLDAGEMSDSSVLSSAFPGAVRTESPCSDRSMDRKRRSLVLPGLSSSPRRQHSPARMSNPHSPLRMPKPRMSSGAESLPSPIVSPSTHASELAHYHYRHHRRQSSATSSDVTKPPVSPHLTSASQPQPRPAPPSIKDFEIIKPISKGAFGSVYLSKKKTTGEYFAIKVLKKADMVAKNQVTNVKAERAIMMWQGESDFVAKLYWTFSSKDYLYLVMEYLNGGDCASLVKILGGLPEDWAKKYIAEVVLGVEHLHGRGIVHRDLKPDNLLIDQKGHLKLTDFGLSRMGLVGRQKRVLKSMNEPAPDLLKQGPFPRATSIASSRSASFDFQAPGSPGSTPQITPDLAGSLNQPSYFSLNQSGLSRQTSRRASGYRSDSGGSENLNAIFRNFSLSEPHETSNFLPPSSLPVPVPVPSRLPEEDYHSEIGESPRLFPLQPTLSNSAPYGTPPQQSMMPPLMALFDPDDHNRRFVGTPDYLAPETINGLGQDEMGDWWSLGCIMFEFLFGYPPFNASTPDEVFDNILHRRINWPEEAEELASHEAIDLMNKLMTMDPRERIGANVEEKYPNGGTEIRSHPWFSDINWETLLEDQAQFVPNLENPEDTEYFDARGATLQPFAEELEEGPSSQPATTADRPHDALFKVRSQVNSMKRPLMPLHIPPHVRDSRSRRLSEPTPADDFGSFSFKNLPMLEKANKDVIQKLRQEAMQAQQRQYAATASQPNTQPQGPTPPPPPPSSGPSLEGSPLPMPLQRTLSQNKGNNRPSSPSGLSQANSSPSRPSQPSSPLLVQFSTGNNHERRKTSGSSSTTNSLPSSGSFAAGGGDQSRMASIKRGSSASSPIKTSRAGTHSPDKTPSGQRHGSVPTTRTRSQTIGSQDGELSSSLAKESYVAGHYKRRSQLFDISPSSSDNEDPRTKALLKVQRRRHSSRRLSQISVLDGPFFRPLDVLICEDHPVSRMVMERLFEKLRCRTITAVNGAEAMRYALSEVQFDIIMTEFKLPQVNGADIARMVRETRSANRHTPIVAVTGYLQDFPETHHFDGLIEKPPTLTKLTEALCKFCQWKPPPKDYSPSQPLAGQPSALRHTALVTNAEHSPSSTTSSGFAVVPSSSYQGSSRADSIGSSYFGDVDSIKADDAPIVVSRQNDEWMSGQQGGLGISDESMPKENPSTEATSTASSPTPVPHLIHAVSAPAAIDPSSNVTPRKQRSSESIKAKRQSMEKKRYECAESGDDEDEELGHAHVRTPSSRSRSHRPVSKLGIEMMRTNSRGSVVSGSEELLKKEREAMERSRNAESENAIESGDDPMSSSPSRAMQDRFERLAITEDTIAERTEEELSPASSPLSHEVELGATTAMPLRQKRPSCSQHDTGVTEIYTGPENTSSALDASTETLKKGQNTPPIVLTQDDESSASVTNPHTPLNKPAKDTISLDPDSDPTADSETTPRPLHTPSPRWDFDHTPRPFER